MFYLAAVLLKQFIKKHWDEDDEDNFEHPVVACDEKVSLNLLPSSAGILSCCLFESSMLGH